MLCWLVLSEDAVVVNDSRLDVGAPVGRRWWWKEIQPMSSCVFFGRLGAIGAVGLCFE